MSKREYPSQREIPRTVEVATVQLGAWSGYHWRVVSDCGVVKIYSSRDGCMVALNPSAARALLDQLYAAVDEAADLTEIRSFGAVRRAAAFDGESPARPSASAPDDRSER